MRRAKRLSGMGAATRGDLLMMQTLKFKMVRVALAAATIALFVESLGACRRFG